MEPFQQPLPPEFHENSPEPPSVSAETKALPGSKPPQPEQVGRGQSVVVLALAGLSVAIAGYLMLFIVPPAYAAPSIAFGGPLLLGFCVIAHQLHYRGLAPGDPPESPDA